jgi:hypothetical protein
MAIYAQSMMAVQHVVPVAKVELIWLSIARTKPWHTLTACWLINKLYLLSYLAKVSFLSAHIVSLGQIIDKGG